ncbi:MAG TPA: lactate utilization protein, partial [Gammaproteobacteria bacterium]|nr:lactate utilization protein [Gammaproteobacteria bacterium]
MSTTTQTVTFGEQVDRALNNVSLQQAMGRAESGFVETRRHCVEAMPEFEVLRDTARDIKEHTLEHLDSYLEIFEEKVIENGGTVHWASSGEEACRIILGICQQADAR